MNDTEAKPVSSLTCSICAKPIDIQYGGWAGGHSADPINNGRCCSDCNIMVVLPARLARISQYQQGRK